MEEFISNILEAGGLDVVVMVGWSGGDINAELSYGI